MYLHMSISRRQSFVPVSQHHWSEGRRCYVSSVCTVTAGERKCAALREFAEDEMEARCRSAHLLSSK